MNGFSRQTLSNLSTEEPRHSKILKQNIRFGSENNNNVRRIEVHRRRKMCGRTACYLAPEDLSCCCKYKDASGKESEVPWVSAKFQTVQYMPLYNVAPRDTLACIAAGSHFNNESERLLCPMLWGMIPFWHQGESAKHSTSSHNARLEGVTTSKMYQKPLNQGKRCVIVVNGFYEWQKSESKQPYYMHKKSNETNGQQVLFLAGLFDKWTSGEGDDTFSCTVLTKDANSVISWLHHRSPVILETDDDVRDWLSYQEISAEKAIARLQKLNLSKDAIQWHPVSTTVNNVRNKDKSCIDPVELRKEKKPAGGLMSSWLKTGSMTSKKRQSTDGEDPESPHPKTKSLKKA